jgi:hypothetical protein
MRFWSLTCFMLTANALQLPQLKPQQQQRAQQLDLKAHATPVAADQVRNTARIQQNRVSPVARALAALHRVLVAPPPGIPKDTQVAAGDGFFSGFLSLAAYRLHLFLVSGLHVKLLGMLAVSGLLVAAGSIGTMLASFYIRMLYLFLFSKAANACSECDLANELMQHKIVHISNGLSMHAVAHLQCVIALLYSVALRSLHCCHWREANKLSVQVLHTAVQCSWLQCCRRGHSCSQVCSSSAVHNWPADLQHLPRSCGQ